MTDSTQRIALIGDVHGRADALVAVLDAVSDAGITDGVCNGDVVMRGPDPKRCIALLRSLGWPTVMGNTDRQVLSGNPRPKDHPASSRIGSRSWTYRHLSPDELAWLHALPMVERITFGGYHIVVTHGDQESLQTPITHQSSDDELAAQLDALNADVLVVGHTHRPLVRWIGDRLVINPGTIGESRSHDWQPQWAWLEITPAGLCAHLEVVARPLAPERDDAPED